MRFTGGKAGSQRILTGETENVKPTLAKIREAVFNTLFSLDKTGVFGDLYSGSGMMAFEAASRGFEKVVAFEIHPKSAAIIRENAKRTGLNVDVFTGDVLRLLRKITEKFDVVYIDPPYYGGLYEKTLETLLSCGVCNKGAIVALERPTDVEVDISGFSGTEPVKTKVYGKKAVDYLRIL